jgi:Kef-type K+ transport system membrane component KefB
MRKSHLTVAYILLVGLPLLILFTVLQAGGSLTAPNLAGPVSAVVAAAAAVAPLNLVKLILQIGVILVVSRLVGMAFKRIQQPQVVGEMVAGIMLGPSLLGWAAPAVSKFLFPGPSLGYLSALSQVGVVLFMFLVGVSLNPKELHDHGRAAVLTSHASIVTPFCLGSALALLLYPRLSSSHISFMSFALFMGAAMSITAFPVLARILTERNLLGTRMGTLSIACAAVDDITS